MIKSHLNNEKQGFVKVETKTGYPQLLKDELYGSIWHKLNDGMHTGLRPDSIEHLYDYIRSIDVNDEIISRYEDYKKQWLESQTDLKPSDSRKLIYT